MSLAKFFARPHYTSEATNFIQSLKQQRPELEQGQRQGRALLWDKRIDREQQADLRAGRVAQTAYVYYAYSPKPGTHPSAPDVE
ncbi:MAG: DUF3460 family protein [Burkholderiaceae bacterium]